METRYLQTFLLIVETGSVAEAARRLNITPSAVTQRIRALENEIGQSLLQRSGQRMEPTTIGGGLIADARQILTLADDIKAASSPGGDSGYVRIGVIQTALTGLLPQILLRVREFRPNIDIHLQPGTSSGLFAQLGQGELDAAIIVRPDFALPKALDWMPLRREHQIVVAPHGLDPSDPLELLQSQPFIRYDRNNWGGRIVDSYLRQKNIHTREQFELDSLEAIVIMVSEGLGVSLVPDWPTPWPQGVDVQKFILHDAPCREIGVIWSRTSRRLPVIRSFLTEVGASHCQFVDKSRFG